MTSRNSRASRWPSATGSAPSVCSGGASPTRALASVELGAQGAYDLLRNGRGHLRLRPLQRVEADAAQAKDGAALLRDDVRGRRAGIEQGDLAEDRARPDLRQLALAAPRPLRDVEMPLPDEEEIARVGVLGDQRLAGRGVVELERVEQHRQPVGVERRCKARVALPQSRGCQCTHVHESRTFRALEKAQGGGCNAGRDGDRLG